MLNFRPHIMTWTIYGEPAIEPETGYEIPGEPIGQKTVACRFHLGGIKEFRNEDSNSVQQKGRIRIDAGIEVPKVGDTVIVTMDDRELFNGIIREAFLGGQLNSWRLDV